MLTTGLQSYQGIMHCTLRQEKPMNLVHHLAIQQAPGLAPEQSIWMFPEHDAGRLISHAGRDMRQTIPCRKERFSG